MRLTVLSVAVLLAITSCEKPAKHSEPAIKDLVSKLHLRSGGVYLRSDSSPMAMGCMKPRQAIRSLSTRINRSSDTCRIQQSSIPFFISNPGDDFYPSLKVFSKDGKLIYYAAVSYADCAAGSCGVDSCISTIQVADQCFC